MEERSLPGLALRVRRAAEARLSRRPRREQLRPREAVLLEEARDVERELRAPEIDRVRRVPRAREVAPHRAHDRVGEERRVEQPSEHPGQDGVVQEQRRSEPPAHEAGQPLEPQVGRDPEARRHAQLHVPLHVPVRDHDPRRLQRVRARLAARVEPPHQRVEQRLGPVGVGEVNHGRKPRTITTRAPLAN